VESWLKLFIYKTISAPTIKSLSENRLLLLFWVETPALKTGDSGGKIPKTLVLSRRLRPKNPANSTWFFGQVVHAFGTRQMSFET
jgi:hypothetical protein